MHNGLVVRRGAVPASINYLSPHKRSFALSHSPIMRYSKPYNNTVTSKETKLGLHLLGKGTRAQGHKGTRSIWASLPPPMSEGSEGSLRWATMTKNPREKASNSWTRLV